MWVAIKIPDGARPTGPMTIARVALPVAVAEPFDYWLPANTGIVGGTIVKVRLGRRRIAGVVVGLADEPAVSRDKLQPIDEVVDLPPLPDDVRDLCEFVASYYQAPIGLAYALATPPLRRGRAKRATVEVTMDKRPIPALNEAQRAATESIDAARGSFAAFLLDGVTGSGKTDVYLAAASRSIAGGGQVLMLVPEINLTPQLVSRVARALPGAYAVTLHSGLAEGERTSNWRAAAEGKADVVLGTRLAIFAAMPRLDLIVVDEEHDGSYKQQDTVRYHARDAALWRARRRNVRVVLGSATPSLETFANAEAGRYARLKLAQRADPRAAPPLVLLVPARGDTVRDGLSQSLLTAISRRLERAEQSLVFVNRRGFAPALKCVACAWEAGCPRCSARLVAHRVPPGLVCHHCGHRERIPRACPQCGNVDLLPAGHGTQRLEAALSAHFPDARIARVDRDTTRGRGAFDDVRARMADNEVDILIGTQMLAKGHDFPRLTLVGVLGADNALYSADFRATERLAALLVQVAGRAGRAELPGEVIVQTDFPTHPLHTALSGNAWHTFARELLAERSAVGLPPFANLALLAAESHVREDAEAFLAMAQAESRSLQSSMRANVEIFPPVPAPLARRAGYERVQMLFRSEQRGELNRVLTALREVLGAGASRKVRWAIDVDPASLA